jgi:Na+/H+-dicarboxylate symporter
MAGTSLYQAVASTFIAQLFGIELSLAQQATVIGLATLIAIGSPGVPGGSIVMMVIVLEAIHVPPAGIAVILSVDRILDMCRTVVNITGDSAVAPVVAASEGQLLTEAEVMQNDQIANGQIVK